MFCLSFRKSEAVQKNNFQKLFFFYCFLCNSWCSFEPILLQHEEEYCLYTAMAGFQHTI